MGKLDKTQAKLQFDQRKTGNPPGDDAGPGQAGGSEVLAGEEQDLRQILVAMLHSLNQIDGKIDSLSYPMDRMAERLDIIQRGWSSQKERELVQLEQEQALSTDDQTSGRMRAKLTEFQNTALAEFQHLGKYATARVYGEGERPGLALANLIHPNKESNLIIAILADDDSEIREPELIGSRFRDYYESLYTSRVAPDSEELLNYLVHIELPRLVDVDRESLGAPLTLEEMDKAISSSAEGKAPWP
ncbi:hypothetical protein NDU88_006079 [Pleurodeles waltl]|uniref:Uncharacterized protein n=1 Tax=Pleurodeles waltl TaxID=8319 RepID=A0AAV7NX36_PLEWA|nr:hypothetical protein NDU88_006079 [Pleurodeles waltl]